MSTMKPTREELIAMAPFFGYRVAGDTSEVSTRMLEQSCKALKAGKYTTFMVSLIYPLVTFVPFLIMTIINPCINYAMSLFICLLVLGCLSFATAYIHLWIYNSVSVFCNERMIRIHNIHTSLLFSFMGATIGFYNLYSMDPGFLYIIAITVTSFITIMEYFMCLFQRRHMYMCTTNSCQDDVKDNVLCFKRSKDALNAMGVLFVFSWSGLMISMIFLQYTLYDYVPGDVRPVESCTALIP